MIQVDKKEGEHVGSFIFRFNKKIRNSGIVREVRKRRFQDRSINKNKRRQSALYRVQKQGEIKTARKYGTGTVSGKNNS